MNKEEPIYKKEQKSVAIAVKYSLEFLTAFNVELQNNPELSIGAFYRKFLKYMRWDQPDVPYPLINQGSLLAHLYGMIVYPKETLMDTLPEEIMLAKLSKAKWGKYQVLSIPHKFKFKGVKPDKWPLYFFVTKLRNAISHGGIEIDQAMNFTFTDLDGTVIKFEIEELVKFVYELYREYLNDWKFE